MRLFVTTLAALPCPPLTSGSSPSCIAWLSNFLSHGFIDTFSYFHPKASDRFTCWDQYKNRRYANEGTRIDYILADQTLAPRLLPGPSLVCGQGMDPDSPMSALWAATAGGLWAAAPFDGSGIGDAPMHAYSIQFHPPHTGMIYTPPQFSDHVGVSLLLQRGDPDVDLVLDTRSCRSCLPHLRQQSVKSFFNRKAKSKNASEGKILENTSEEKLSESTKADHDMVKEKGIFDWNRTEKKDEILNIVASGQVGEDEGEMNFVQRESEENEKNQANKSNSEERDNKEEMQISEDNMAGGESITGTGSAGAHAFNIASAKHHSHIASFFGGERPSFQLPPTGGSSAAPASPSACSLLTLIPNHSHSPLSGLPETEAAPHGALTAASTADATPSTLKRSSGIFPGPYAGKRVMIDQGKALRLSGRKEKSLGGSSSEGGGGVGGGKKTALLPRGQATLHGFIKRDSTKDD